MRHWMVFVVGVAILAMPAAGSDKSGVRPGVLNVPRGPGSVFGLAESFEVSLNSGSIRESISIALPPGSGGHTPSLSLQYDSGTGNGPLGLGWALSGSLIQRQTSRGLPTYQADDVLTLDGVELVEVSPGIFRQRREDTPIRIRRSGSGFEVDLPDGRTRRYGIDPSGRVESEGSVFSWYLQDELDVFGNRISWFYEKDGGQPYLVRLEWSRRAGGADNSVELAYSEREDALTGYRSTFPVRIARRLERITVRAQGRLYRRYELRYHSDPTVSLLA